MSLGQIPISTSMRGVYNFDAGTSADSAASPVNGTDANMTYNLASGKLGKGALFNGSSSKISVADNTKFTFTAGTADTAFTFSCWAYIANIANNQVIFAKRDASFAEYDFRFSSSALQVLLWSNGATVAYIGQSITITGLIANNSWVYLTATYDGTATTGGIKLYLNGKALTPAATSSGVYVHMIDTTAALGIGNFPQGTSGWWLNGRLDEVILDGREWTPSEIRKKYTQAKGKLAPM